MKFASFRVAGRPTWGAVEEAIAYDLGAGSGSRYSDLKSFLQSGSNEDLKALRVGAQAHPTENLEWLPVIPNPEKILCVGLNYEMHRKETGRSEVAHPTIFTRFPSSQTAHLKTIVRPRVTENLDFEGELAVVIGKPGRYIDRSSANDHVAGFSCYNDASVRDWQYHTTQFTPGKNFPQTGALGPWMVTPDEMGKLGELRIATTLNGTVVQQAQFDQMIFDIATIIEYCSSFTQLEIGDVIATGTPGGVGAKRTPPLWMKPGDVVEVSIDRIGVLRNTIGEDS